MNTLFRLPIYSESRAEFEATIEMKVEKYLARNDLIRSQRILLHIRGQIEKENGWGCDYNRAIGWIDVSKGTGGVSYRVFSVDSRRKAIKNRSLRILTQDESITWHTIMFKPPYSNEEITNEIRSTLDWIVQNCIHFKGCFVDLSSFLNVSPYLDWNSLLRGNPGRT